MFLHYYILWWWERSTRILNKTHNSRGAEKTAPCISNCTAQVQHHHSGKGLAMVFVHYHNWISHQITSVIGTMPLPVEKKHLHQCSSSTPSQIWGGGGHRSFHTNPLSTGGARVWCQKEPIIYISQKLTPAEPFYLKSSVRGAKVQSGSLTSMDGKQKHRWLNGSMEDGGL